MDKVEEFILRRFKQDCNWTNGNCYYFALILKDRFKNGIIYYDVIDGHFITKINNNFYDWTGKHIYSEEEISKFVEWDKFESYDSLWKNRIIRDCLN